MARMIPNVPTLSLSPEAARVFRLLKHALPEERYTAWLSLTIAHDPTPEFLVLGDDKRALLLKVSDVTPHQVREARDPNFIQRLFGDKANASTGFAEPEQVVIREFITRFGANLSSGSDGEIDLIPSVLLFPNVTGKDLRSVANRHSSFDIAWAGKEILHPHRFEAWIEDHLGPVLAALLVDTLRSTFAPETVIPHEFTVRDPIKRHVDAKLAEHLFDYDQEWAMKVDLQLPQALDTEAESDYRLRLVNGVAGSGKSLLIVYRAYLLMQLAPASKVLILTHNRPLTHDLQYRYHRLGGDNVFLPEICTFMSWCKRLWPEGERWQKPIGRKKRENIALQVWDAYLSDTTISEQQLLDELDWFKDRLFTKREDYLQANRRGRGFVPDQTGLDLIFEAMVAYNQELQRRGLIDWTDVPRHLWRTITEGRVETGIYDAILVDEAQFFAPIWFEIIKCMLKSGAGQLFLVADPTQGFLKRGQSWLASGLDVRGKSLRLNKSYRTTKEILSFASIFYRTRLPDDKEDIVAPDFMDMPNGVVPELVSLTAQQDEITRVVNEIRALVDRGVPPHHFLVIHTEWWGVDQLVERLNSVIYPGVAANAKDVATGKHIRVSTLNACTGLESPIVFLVGTHDLYQREQSLRISDRERTELIRDNTRKLYTAITRAGQRLIITYVGDPPQVFRQVVGELPGWTPGF